MTKIKELFGHDTNSNADWTQIVSRQVCPFLERKCIKVRKSQPEISIGTCTVSNGQSQEPIVICPFRFKERNQVFMDCFQLLKSHEPGNELHVIPEISVPGGSVDYFFVSTNKRRVRDFVGVELQTLDTTGTVWPERQRFLARNGIAVAKQDVNSTKPYGINWKMTAKTILVQLHHKVATFEHLGKAFVLVVQDLLANYMRREFDFSHVGDAKLGDPMHFHSYQMNREGDNWRIQLVQRFSTDTAGIARCLGLQAEAKVELDIIVKQLEAKISDGTLLRIA